jgi:predicted ATPase
VTVQPVTRSPRPPFITRVRIENYKSIARCDVTLGRFNVLLGLNAAGKSNFLDALRFVRDALSEGAAEAVASRGGLDEVLCRVPAPASSATIALEFQLEGVSGDREIAWEGRYEITIGHPLGSGGPNRGGVRVDREFCELYRPGRPAKKEHRFLQRDRTSKSRRAGRLELSMLGDTDPFGDLHFALSEMFFYSPDLSELRAPQPKTDGDTELGEDGAGLGSSLARLGQQERKRLSAYVAAIVPDVVDVGSTDPDGDYLAARMTLAPEGSSEQYVFRAESMSEGTIRAIGLLTALFQPPAREGWIPLIAVEEPELALHPLAAGVLYDALTEASEYVQVLVTSQSAELLDRKEADLSDIRVVVAERGLTVIGDVDEVSRSIVAEGLATPADLLRSNQFQPVVKPFTPASAPEEAGE